MSMHCLPMLKRNITIYPHLQWILRKFPGFFPVPAFSTVNIIQKSVNIWQEIISVSWSHDPERENRLSLLFSLFLCELSRLEAQKSSLTPIDPMIEEIIRLIHSTPQTFFTAGEIASRYYICERTLNNRFHKYCKKTFPAFQMETKLEMVRQFLLTQPDTKLREAAINYGFCDEFHLSKAFKKHFGLSPSQYRQLHG